MQKIDNPVVEQFRRFRKLKDICANITSIVGSMKDSGYNYDPADLESELADILLMIDLMNHYHDISSVRINDIVDGYVNIKRQLESSNFDIKG